jgi:hypothetical protein
MFTSWLSRSRTEPCLRRTRYPGLIGSDITEFGHGMAPVGEAIISLRVEPSVEGDKLQSKLGIPFTVLWVQEDAGMAAAAWESGEADVPDPRPEASKVLPPGMARVILPPGAPNWVTNSPLALL